MSCTAGVSHYGFVPLCGNPLPDSEVRAPRTGYGNDPTFHYEPIVSDRPSMPPGWLECCRPILFKTPFRITC